MSLLLKRLFADPSIQHTGNALDVGFHTGANALTLAEKGYKVIAIDVEEKRITAFAEEAKARGISISKQDVTDFAFEKDYNLILANNIFFFLSDAETVLRIVDNCFKHLAHDGYFIFSLLGGNDSWVKDKNYALFDFEEIKQRINEAGLTIYFSSTEEGYGPMMNGEIKYWHIHKFIVHKP